MGRPKKKWSELSTERKAVIVALLVVQLTLATSAWADLARRTSDEIRGKRWWWAIAIGVNFFGPMAYFRWGRLHERAPLIVDGATVPIPGAE